MRGGARILVLGSITSAVLAMGATGEAGVIDRSVVVRPAPTYRVPSQPMPAPIPENYRNPRRPLPPVYPEPPRRDPLPPPVVRPEPGRGTGNGRVHPIPARGRRIPLRPVRTQSEHEAHAAERMARAIANRGCERLGEVIRDLSNDILSSAHLAARDDSNLTPIDDRDRRGQLRREARLKVRRHFVSPEFWTHLWDRLTDAYQACDMPCFDDGQAVGEISATAYCSASISLGGLNAPGFMSQSRLPLCQNAIFVGCQKGYRDTARSIEGCSRYTEGGWTEIFGQYQSQDCHMDAGS